MDEKDRSTASRLEHASSLQSDDISKPELVEVRAREHIEVEHSLSLWQAIQSCPMAIFWCLMVSMCVIMEGYDTILIGNFYAYPQFAAKYGQFIDEHGQHQLSAAWQAGLGNASAVGCFFGVMLNGYLVDIFGQKRVVLGALMVLSCTIFMTFLAPNIIVLMVGELLCGLPWGIFASSAPAYASEVLPMTLRVYLTSYTNMCFIIGQLIAAAVLATLVDRPDEWAFRIPFALQWTWPAVLIPILFFAPESPWHLVRKGRIAEAERSLERLYRKGAVGVNIKATLADIIHTNELEEQLTSGTSYLDCFRGVERRRTEIACVAFAGQVLSGSTFAYNSTYFFQQVGLSTDATYKLNTGGTALALFGTLVNWFALMPYFGRRAVYLAGMFAMSAILFTIGILNVWTDRDSVGMAQAVLTLAWTFCFQLSAGQLGWSLPAEVGSTRLRQKTVCLARNAYYVCAVVAGVLQPYFINPGKLDLKGYVGCVWGSTAFLVFLWAWFRLPETKGRTYEELDWLFARRTPTREFKTARVDIFDREERRKLECERRNTAPADESQP